MQITEGKSPVEFLSDLAAQYGKQVFLAEVGYRSLDGAAMDPGIWDSSGAVDLQEQQDLYSALFQVFTSYGGEWFAGMHLWNWDPVSWGTDNTAFSPQDKPALQVVRDWFSGEITPEGRSITGTKVADRLDGGVGEDTIGDRRGHPLPQVQGIRSSHRCWPPAPASTLNQISVAAGILNKIPSQTNVL